jgi:hypothetical protein
MTMTRQPSELNLRHRSIRGRTRLRDHATAFLSHPALIIVAYVIAADSAKRVFYRNPAKRK